MSVKTCKEIDTIECKKLTKCNHNYVRINGVLTAYYRKLDSSWRNAQIWLAISLGSKSLRPQVCFLDPKFAS